jgi:hypothetical protein
MVALLVLGFDGFMKRELRVICQMNIVVVEDVADVADEAAAGARDRILRALRRAETKGRWLG